MATNPNDDHLSLTRRLQASGEVPYPTTGPVAPVPARPPQSNTVAARLGRAVRDLPGEAVRAVDDFIDDPIGEGAKALAPFPGAGGGLRMAGAGLNALRTARALPGAGASMTAARASVPTAGQFARRAFPATVGLGGAGLALGEVDRAQSAGTGAGAAPAGSGQRASTRTRRGGIPFGQERQASLLRNAAESEIDTNRQYGAAQVPIEPDQADRIQLRGNQGAVIRNPNAMSPLDQLRLAAKSFKGSPSLRRAAADMIMGQEQAAENAHQAALNRESAADMAQVGMQAKARESGADRRLQTRLANAAMFEDRRTGDLNRQVTREGNLLAAGARAGTGKKPADFVSALYEDYLPLVKDPVVAAQLANRAGVTAGAPIKDSPVSNLAQSIEDFNITQGRKAVGDRWFASNDPGFDQTTAVPVKRDWWERNFSIWPGGLDYSDVKWRDANGRVNYTPRSALPPGETIDSYALRRMRQRALLGLE